ncbi:MAG: dephospho-CoA kinase [Clostridiales bacterium]|nr:dephospho-CoA kinase [Clostridiales bacterium]
MPTTPHIIGLTGGIGAGKSTAAEILRRLGARVLDADSIAHSLREPGGACHAQVKALFGSAERAAIARKAFADETLRKQLNAIVHPAVLDALRGLTSEILSEDPSALIVWEVPLLFESGYHREVGHSLLITAPTALRVERLMRSRGYTSEQARERMAAQLPEAEKIPLADTVLANDGDLRILEARLRQWFADYRKEAR